MSGANTRAGILLMIGATFVFAVQDAVSRHLASNYNLLMVVMIRYWFFAAFVIWLAARQKGGFRASIATAQPGLQIARGVLLAAEVCVTVLAFVLLGLVAAHAIFAVYPLMIAALAGPVLGERVGWRRWTAIAVGFAGMTIILQPGAGVLSPAAPLALLAALMFALYSLATRYVARRDSAFTSFFWTGIAGAVAMTLAGIWFWEPMRPADWGWMAALSVMGVLGHYLLIRAYAAAEAGTVQPFAYFQLVFVSLIGVGIFGESVGLPVILGAALIVGAGVFTLLRSNAAGGADGRDRSNSR